VTQAGVGTNRYGYSGGDPVNGSDPGGHSFGGHEKPDAQAGHTGAGGDFSDRDRSSLSDQIRRHPLWANVGSTWYNGAEEVAGVLGKAFGVHGNIIGYSPRADGVSIFTRNSPITTHAFSNNGTLIGESLGIRLSAGAIRLGGAAIGAGVRAIMPALGLILTPTYAANGDYIDPKNIFYHYTTLDLAKSIFQRGVLKGPAYVTNAQMSPSDVENIIFIGNPNYAGRGSGLVGMVLSQEYVDSNLVPDIGTNGLGWKSTSSIRNGSSGVNFFYGGPNEFGGAWEQ
jgi:hypothetical protein